MSRSFVVLLTLLATLAGCDQPAGHPTREKKILAQLPWQEAYTHNIERMGQLLAPRFPALSEEQVDQVLREHLTMEDQRQDLLRLYSEQHFSDVEFDLVLAATADPVKAKALGQSLEGRQLSEKLTRLMRESANDPDAKARAAQRMQQIEEALGRMQRQALEAG
ncbi:hypothetical protein [Pseudomonas sp. UBA6562]|uniref:hypothetical protein n=1 Tax=Pseudomonas sp. UBA6562 TaxID=1947332 RepID=UPI0025FD61D7|nr:hypothetical protein [Pseudomonas sp. UBA6562]